METSTAPLRKPKNLHAGDSTDTGREPVVGCYEHKNEFSDYMKCENFPEQQSKYELVKDCSLEL
jgi:hypothetical protein